MDANLTLEKVKQIVRKRKAVHKQQTISIAENNHRCWDDDELPQGRRACRIVEHPTTEATAAAQPEVYWCGKGPHRLHLHGACPSKEAICHKYKKKGHYSAQCFSKGVAVTFQPINDLDITYLITIGTGRHASWKAKIVIEGEERYDPHRNSMQTLPRKLATELPAAAQA